MPTLLIKNASRIYTFNEENSVLRDASILLDGNKIEALGEIERMPSEADDMIDAAGMILLPGLTNCHHHFYQTLTRAYPPAQNAGLFPWLATLYPLWGAVTEEALYVSAKVAMSELLLSGCTTTVDHAYIVPHDSRIDVIFEAADDLGMRLHLAHGSIIKGISEGGLAPDTLARSEHQALAESQRLIEIHHDPNPFAMKRVVLAPIAIEASSSEFFRETASLARSFRNVMLHTHLAENRVELERCLQTYGMRPVAYLESLGWTGADVWWAHAVWLEDDEITLLAQSGTGVAHCPSSNMRLGSGIARIHEMLEAGVDIGIGVDGSSSNDSGNMLAEVRMAMLLQRVRMKEELFGAHQALNLATRGSAAVIGRDDLGQLVPGKAADLIGLRLDRLELAGGAVHDALGTIVFSPPERVDLSVVNGRITVRDGELVGVDLPSLVRRHNQLAQELSRSL